MLTLGFLCEYLENTKYHHSPMCHCFSFQFYKQTLYLIWGVHFALVNWMKNRFSKKLSLIYPSLTSQIIENLNSVIWEYFPKE